MKRSAAVLIAGLLGMPWSAAAEPAAASASLGRALFQGTRGFAAGTDATMPRLPATYAACANCHGDQGDGRREGGSEAPSIRISSLLAPRAEASGYQSGDAVLAAITKGQGRDGENLAPQMPRYRLEIGEQVALLDYLQLVGTYRDFPPGVSARGIRLGTILPLSGSYAVQGNAILEGMREVVATTNAAGGIHGRTVTLIASDGALSAPERALLEQNVFAVVGGMWDGRNPAIEATLEASKVPVIASLILRAENGAPGQWASDLLPPQKAQAGLLSFSLSHCTVSASGQRWLIGADAIQATGIDRVFSSAASVASVPDAIAGPGCVGFALRDISDVEPIIPAGWNRRIGLPFPRQVLSNGGNAIWQTLGQASARIGMETLAVAGIALHERTLLDALPRLNNFEALPGAPVRYSAQRRFAWDADVLEQDFDTTARTARPAKDAATH